MNLPLQKSCRKSALAIFFLITIFGSFDSLASHFRYSNITWTRANSSTQAVDFTVTYAYRLSYGSDSFIYYYGDGQSINLYTSDAAVATKVGEVLVNNDPNDVGSVVIYKFKFSHTYVGAGPFTSYFSNCCRLSNLVYGGDGSMNFSSKICFDNGNLGSPKINAPSRIYMRQGAVNTFQFTASDPQNDVLSYSLASINGDGTSGNLATIPSYGGNIATISSTGLLSWNTAATITGQIFAGRIKVTESRSCSQSEMDFVIEIVPNATPICSVLGDFDNPINANTPFNITVVGTHPNLTGATRTAIPTGMVQTYTISPPDINIPYSWTPTASQVGLTQKIGTTFTTTTGSSITCEFNVRVVADCSTLNGTVSVLGTCLGSTNGSASVVATGGTPPYSYSWLNNGTFVSTASITSLAPSTNTLIVKDANGCFKSLSYTIPTKTPTFAIDTVVTVKDSCSLGKGKAIATVSGTVSPFTYKWTTSGSFLASNVYSNALSGNYTLTVKDNTGCQVSKAFTIGNDLPIANFTYTIVGGVVTFTNTSTGYADAFWNFNSTTSTPQNTSNLPITMTYAAGTYKVKLLVYHKNGCTSTITKTIVVNPCPAILPISNPILANSGTLQEFSASNTIQSSATIAMGAKVTYKANKVICLLPGTDISNGSVFETSFLGCN
jgi:hypothetical protein